MWSGISFCYFGEFAILLELPKCYESFSLSETRTRKVGCELFGNLVMQVGKEQLAGLVWLAQLAKWEA